MLIVLILLLLDGVIFDWRCSFTILWAGTLVVGWIFVVLDYITSFIRGLIGLD